MTDRRKIHDRVLNAANKTELAGAYAEWAASYDHDLVDEMGYAVQHKTVDLLLTRLDVQNPLVLDAGCGTGLIGEALAGAGIRRIDGLDYSNEMLAEAEKKGCYRSLMQGDLLATLALDDGAYDAVTCVGTLTRGHVGPAAFDELIRVTRPGGYLCFTVRDDAWEQDGFDVAVAALRERGAWDVVDAQIVPYIVEEGSECRLCLCRVPG